MRLRSTRWRFVLITVATALGVLLLARLGFWQLDRAGQKQAMLDTMLASERKPALRNTDLPVDPKVAMALQYRPVRMRGHWQAEATVFLDNRQMAGRHGFIVLTPLRLSGADGAVLVQRGWVPRHAQQRTLLPEVVTPAGEVEIEGLMAPPPSRLFEFAQGGGGTIRQNLDLDDFAREIRLALRPFTVLQGDTVTTQGDGLLRTWSRPAVDVHKNYGYALQWFALAALMTGLYVWFQLIRPRRRAQA